MTRDYSIAPARYAKNMMAIKCVADGSRWKTRTMRLAQYVANFRYSGREHSYIVSKAAAKKFEKLWDEGWDASFIKDALIPPESTT